MARSRPSGVLGTSGGPSLGGIEVALYPALGRRTSSSLPRVAAGLRGGMAQPCRRGDAVDPGPALRAPHNASWVRRRFARPAKTFDLKYV
jgi:hypothetical protein